MSNKIIGNDIIEVEINGANKIEKVTIKKAVPNYEDTVRGGWLLGNNGVIDFNAVEGMNTVIGTDKEVKFVIDANVAEKNRGGFGLFVIKKLIYPDTAEYLHQGMIKILIDGKDYEITSSLIIDSIAWPSASDTIPANFFCGINVKEVLNIDKVGLVGDRAFKDSYIETINWPSECNYIPSEAFAGSKIRCIGNTDHISKICAGAFRGCTELKHFDIPPNVTMIPEECFNNSGVEEITGTKHLKSIGDMAFSHCRIHSFIWPDKCHTIPAGCFLNTVSLNKVTNLDSVIEIKDNAFSTVSVKELSFSENLKRIGGSAFAFSLIESVKGLENVESIGESAFEYCNIAEIAWPQGCSEIKKNTFTDCTNLRKITGLQNILSICENAFKRSSIEKIDLADSLCSYIGEKAFSDSRLKEILLGYYTQCEPNAFPSKAKVEKY